MKMFKPFAALLIPASIAIAWTGHLPRIFVLGDSISLYYGPYLKTYLNGIAEIEQKKIETLGGREFSRNGGDSRRVLDYLTAKLKDPAFSPDYILLNCGLHDIGRDTLTRAFQVPPDEYRQNLERIMDLLQQKRISVLWVTTTPVVDSIHNTRTRLKLRYEADLERYNQIAAGVCKRHHVKMIDLHDFTMTLGTGVYMDNVHYIEEARTLQAAYIAGAVRIILHEAANAR
jgi:lysophospholipase L1-like esterase